MWRYYLKESLRKKFQQYWYRYFIYSFEEESVIFVFRYNYIAEMQTFSAERAFKHLQILSTNSPQARSRCFLFLIGNGKQHGMFASVDLFLNMASVYRELSTKLRMWTNDNTLKLDIM